MKNLPKPLLYVIIVLPLFSLINILVLDLMFHAPASNYTTQATRFLLTVLLSYFLYRKSNIARWFTIIVSVLAVLVFVSSALFVESTNLPFIILGSASLVVSCSSIYILLFSGSSKRYFKK